MDVKKNTIMNLLGVVLPLMAALYAIPKLLHLLGDERFSVLLLIWALIGYFSLFDFGVGRALTYEISQKLHKPRNVISSYLKAGLLIVFVSAILGFFLVFGTAEIFVKKYLNISPLLVPDIVDAFIVAAIAVIPTTITSGLRGGLEGVNKFRESNINRAILGVSVFALPLVAVKFHGVSLSIIAMYLLIARVMVMILAFWQLRHILFLKASLSPIRLTPSIFRYGFWVSVSGVLGPLMIYGDRFLLASILSVSVIAYYATPQEGLLRLLVIPGALASALFHDLSANNKNIKKLWHDFVYYQKKVGFIMAGIVLLVILFSQQFYTYWISEEFSQQAYIPTVILSIGIFFNSLGLIALTTLSSLGKVKYIGFLHLTELVFFIPFFYLFTKNFGIIGASIVWTLRSVLDFYFLHSKTKKVLLLESFKKNV
jgi:O-antigen/teichoic acid export membrane protein